MLPEQPASPPPACRRSCSQCTAAAPSPQPPSARPPRPAPAKHTQQVGLCITVLGHLAAAANTPLSRMCGIGALLKRNASTAIQALPASLAKQPVYIIPCKHADRRCCCAGVGVHMPAQAFDLMLNPGGHMSCDPIRQWRTMHTYLAPTVMV